MGLWLPCMPKEVRLCHGYRYAQKYERHETTCDDSCQRTKRHFISAMHSLCGTRRLTIVTNAGLSLQTNIGTGGGTVNMLHTPAECEQW